MFGGGGGAANPNASYEFPQPPSDSVSSLAWSPTANHLAATSWDKTCRVWEVQIAAGAQPTLAAQKSVAAEARLQWTSESPLLCSAWSPDGTAVFTGGCDGKAKMKVLGTQQEQQIAEHANPIHSIGFCPEIKAVATCSWDSTVKLWDMQSPNPAATLQLPAKPYRMSVNYPLLVVVCEQRGVVIYNLQTLSQGNTQPFKCQLSDPLKLPTRAVACYPDKTGYALGSSEGRCVFQSLDETTAQVNLDKFKSFAFKAHRTSDSIYAVNGLDFHKQTGVLGTVGGDGTFCFWHKEARHRLKLYQSVGNSLTACAFSAQGDMFAHAAGYDWSKGFDGHTQQTAVTRVLVHRVQKEDITHTGGRH